LIKTNIVNKIVKKYTNQMRKDIFKTKSELANARIYGEELYKDYQFLIENMGSEIDTIISLIKVDPKDQIIIPELKKEIAYLKEEMEKILEEKKTWKK